MFTFSGYNDNVSGVRVKHIYSDNHNLKSIKSVNGEKVGSLNYKMHFKSCDNFDVTNTLRPESLKLEVYGVRQPYPVYHSASIPLKYEALSVVSADDAIFYESSKPYSFRFIADSNFMGALLIDKSLDILSKLGDGGDYGLGEVKLLNQFISDKHNDGWVNYSVVNNDQSLWENGKLSVLKFNKPFNSQGRLYYYNSDNGGWVDAGINIPSTPYTKYTSIYITTLSPNIASTSTRFSSDPYGYNELNLIEVIDTSDYDVLYVKPELQYMDKEGKDFWQNTGTFDSNMLYASNYQDATFIGLGKSSVTALLNLSISVKTIPENETVDLNVHSDLIEIKHRFEVFPSDTLSGGVSLICQHGEYNVTGYIPFATTTNVKRQYIDGNCNLRDYRFFNLDFSKIVLKVTRDYHNRVEYVEESNLMLKSYSVINSNEVS